MNRRVKRNISRAVAAAALASIGHSAWASPFVYFEILARNNANQTDAFTPSLAVTTGEVVQYEVLLRMAPVGTSNQQGAAAAKTISSLTMNTGSTNGDGVNTFEFDMFQAAAAAVQVNFGSALTLNTDPTPQSNDSWGAGTGPSGGTPTVRSGSNNDLIGIKAVHANGVQTGVTADTSTYELMGSGTFTVASGSGLALVQAKFHSPVTLKYNGGTILAPTATTEGGSDPYISYQSLTLNPVTGNNSDIVLTGTDNVTALADGATRTVDFGRVLLNSVTSQAITLQNNHSNSTTYSLTRGGTQAGGTLALVSATGNPAATDLTAQNMPGGTPGTAVMNVGLNTATTGDYHTAGANIVTVTNTGTGVTDTNDKVDLQATVLGDRSPNFTLSLGNIGRRLAGSSLSLTNQSVGLTSTGSDNNFTRVAVNGVTYNGTTTTGSIGSQAVNIASVSGSGNGVLQGTITPTVANTESFSYSPAALTTTVSYTATAVTPRTVTLPAATLDMGRFLNTGGVLRSANSSITSTTGDGNTQANVTLAASTPVSDGSNTLTLATDGAVLNGTTASSAITLSRTFAGGVYGNLTNVAVTNPSAAMTGEFGAPSFSTTNTLKYNANPVQAATYTGTIADQGRIMAGKLVTKILTVTANGTHADTEDTTNLNGDSTAGTLNGLNGASRSTTTSVTYTAPRPGNSADLSTNPVSVSREFSSATSITAAAAAGTTNYFYAADVGTAGQYSDSDSNYTTRGTIAVAGDSSSGFVLANQNMGDKNVNGTGNDFGTIHVTSAHPIEPGYVLLDINAADTMGSAGPVTKGTNNSADNLVDALNFAFGAGSAFDTPDAFGGILSRYAGATFGSVTTNYDVVLHIPQQNANGFDFRYDFSQVTGLGPDEIVNVGVVPEPASMGLIALATLAGLTRIRRRRTQKV